MIGHNFYSEASRHQQHNGDNCIVIMTQDLARQ
jgi:hypothetical protein